MNHDLQGVCPLAGLGVIRVAGEDAASFLNGQLTQDFALLGMSEARLAAYCSAKGRMLASFVGWKRGPAEILLVTGSDILAATAKRLSMFVLRAKVKITDASSEYLLAGLAGDSVKAVAGEEGKPWSRSDKGDASIVHLYPAAGQPRALWLAPAGAVLPAGPVLDQTLWDWSEVRSGVARISAPIADALVPQMLNYESVGGVSFKKGCYPGQEVVARSQFRGTLKRRGFLLHGDAPMAAGQEIFHVGDASQPCGLVAQAAPSPQGGWEAIASLQVAAAQLPGLQLGMAGGPPLSLVPLPYALLEDI